jgi:hypothetical protein
LRSWQRCEYGQYTADIFHLATGIVADAAGPFIFAGTEAKQPGLWMLAVYRHCLTLTDNFH